MRDKDGGFTPEEMDELEKLLYCTSSTPACFMDLETGEIIDSGEKLHAFLSRKGVKP